VKKFEEEINNEIIGSVERQPTKKRPNVRRNAIFYLFFVINEPFKKNDVHQKYFCKNLAF
jgi:hypothetical protein